MATLPAGWTPAPGALAGRTVLITGATGGLGRASALACAAAGATIVLLGRKVSGLEKLYDEIEALGAPTPAIYPLNLEGATPRDYEDLADTIARECGGLQGVVHAAAHFTGLQPAVEIKPEEWMRSLQVNLNGPFLLTQAVLPLLQQQSDASVVFVHDDPSRVSRSFWGAYGVAKAALAGLVSILHDETENSPVRIHGLLPPPMRTALRRMGYFGENTMDRPEPSEFAPAVVYLLCADGAASRGQTLDLRAG
ncbi:SDR family NAD(P)-dependent oxidoreductase [Tahibacter amnicola]|uniref:SDR family NAD(P)-dependent oxidoreductase n=1 Tax=Tahibacter amnicola TaxID=2976241 RepID=A0ABY6BP10_9GAMM|nr:SDR family NAD(P)-dependent oxidoreductase [Tahibacter amnicola]UXI69507.1 SDR family NAD(P)-dependent oxidoreductase [Tahibacter amnicola]